MAAQLTPEQIEFLRKNIGALFPQVEGENYLGTSERYDLAVVNTLAENEDVDALKRYILSHLAKSDEGVYLYNNGVFKYYRAVTVKEALLPKVEFIDRVAKKKFDLRKWFFSAENHHLYAPKSHPCKPRV